MVFRDFVFPDVLTAFDLLLVQAPLFTNIPPITPASEFIERMRSDTLLAVSVSTEKARSEFIIAPILSQLRHMMNGAFGLFSGIEFNVDAARGLNGYCDFILTRSPMTVALTAPVVAMAEAKNENLHTGLGQCIAAMVAAQEFNRKSNSPINTIYGVVTTGSLWTFLRLNGRELVYDPREYYINEIGSIMAILMHILQGNAE